MKSLEHNAIHRSLALMGFRLTEQLIDKRHAGDGYKLAEVVQQYQLDIKGVAGSGAYTDFTIIFQEMIYYAPGQRNIKTEDPQVTHGVQLDTGDVQVVVIVRKWLLDETANYAGAVVRVGVIEVPWSLGAAYAGTVHINFQGFSSPVEDPGYDETP